MTKINIDKFIHLHKYSKNFDFNLEECDELRFLTKFNSGEVKNKVIGDKLHINRSLNKTKVHFFRLLSIPLAACVLLFLVMTAIFKISNNDDAYLKEIYLEAYSQVNNIQVELLNKLPDSEHEVVIRTLKGITFEPVLFIETLPKEMSKEDKILISKKYYSKRVDGARRYAEQICI